MVGISGKLSVRHSRSASRSLLDLLASLARLFASSPTGRAQTLASLPCQRRGGIFFGMSKNPLGVDKGARPLMFIPALATSASERMKTEGFRTLRVLPPGGPPQRVSSSPCPGEELPLWSILIPAAPVLWSQKEICYNFVIKNY